MTDVKETIPGFDELGLAEPVLRALREVGYETPSPIQARTIPHLLAGRDVLGQAQTGTGKTAAFAAPILSRLDPQQREPQVLVLAPTRELAIQVAEAFQRYASHIPDFRVVPIYGGAGYREQIQQLKRGVQVVVGTPGRVMDHMRKRTLVLNKLRCLVLDEADEMLRMGFIDDVEWILQQTPAERQIALFSATMPEAIRRIARTHLREPEEVRIQVKTSTAETIRQRYWLVSGTHKLDGLSRILEAERHDGVIVFARTKVSTEELALKLQARGYAAAALNGDVVQAQRERTVEALKRGELDVLVATDVAARGLDVERISHVINYDVPTDVEAYVHRIGRTGRAGRAGEAILFVAPRERRMLQTIERATRQKIEPMKLPSAELINEGRIAAFKRDIRRRLDRGELDFYRELLEQFRAEHEVADIEVAAALAALLQGDRPMLLEEVREVPPAKPIDRRPRREKKARPMKDPETGMERFRLDVGHSHGVKPGNIVGAIANEAGLESRYIGRVDIQQDHSLVDLPQGMPKEIFQVLKNARVCGRRLGLEKVDAASTRPSKPKKKAVRKQA